MKFNDIRVSTKLWGGILGLLVVALGVGGWSQYQATALADDALTGVRNYEQHISDAIAWRGATRAISEQVIASDATADAVLQSLLDSRVVLATAELGQLQQKIIGQATTEADRTALAQAMRERAAVAQLNQQARTLQQSSSTAAVPADFVEKTYLPAIDRYIGSLDAFVKLQERHRDAAVTALETARRRAVLVSAASAIALLLAGIALAALLARSMSRPLSHAVQVAEAIAAGDLAAMQASDRRDEFGQLLAALSTMVLKLRGVVGEVRNGVASVSSASTEIALGNQDLSSRTEQAASNLQQTAASMEQLTGTVTQSTDTAHRARQLAGTAAQAAERGGAVMSEVVSSMADISGSSRRIGDIIGTIDGIAFQTNILALNAAVEAARAGEQGRGFAVVASEVRNLAQRSAQAAREIKTLIGTSVEKVDVGSRQVAQAGQTMGEIVHSVRQVADLIAEIHAASSEQRDGIGQVNEAVSQLDRMTQQNAALVEESAAAATALRDQAERLSVAISVFRLGEGVDRPAPPVLREVIASPAQQTATRGLVPPPAAAAGPGAAATTRTAAAGAPARTLPKPTAAPTPAVKVAAGEDEWESF
ncbi:methyl-accepting chemotaxis protein [Xylophilus sp. GOD-11R]|uniref:methyl-accepting chemotaxis protein n=1 Tax=Xylophilus sp. GOD-11R TaxID=3089814 RepID=UPI00298C1827|nr:methyl-accepting chemotaxis protein [Xylophilus sp. GOD-11R]WPB56265.1 methyl-accepting chemotaxis protein [Xylophilus sp. GOD-11R]